MPSIKPHFLSSCNLKIKNNQNFINRLSTTYDTSHQIKQISDIQNNLMNSNDQSNKHIQQNGPKRQWTVEQDEFVYELHNQYGNKWAIIAERLKLRTDNCVKNHFYSRLRKGLRKVNKTIDDIYKKKIKQFKTIDLYKIIEASDEKFKQVKSFTNEMTDLGFDLKNRLFVFAEQQNQKSQEYLKNVYKLVEDMLQFTKNYKRKSKKSRRYSPMGIDSIYRANTKKADQKQTFQQNQELKSQQKIKKQTVVSVKIYQEFERQEQFNQNKQAVNQIDKDLTFILKKESLMDNGDINFNIKNKSKSKNYCRFSEDEDDDKNDVEQLKQQRLNHFAQNLLKTFKSYYSFQSFKSKPVFQDFIFQ